MKEQENDYERPEEETEDVDAPGSPEDADDEDVSDAYREFLADRRTIRYEDTADNRRELFDYLVKFSPPLPETPAALFLAFDELRKENKLELMPLAPPKSPKDLTQAEVQARSKGAEPERTPESDVAKDARATLELFRKRKTMTRFKNGALVS